ncbi:MAG: hypothetical protein ABI137_02985 [Antricoccus sp.]
MTTTDTPDIDDRVADAGRPLGATSVGIRVVATLVVLAATLFGTFFGSDTDFPAGPFRMYATRNDPNGIVNSLRLEGVNTGGIRVPVSAGSVGLRRADLEGSLPKMKTDPALLADIAARYAKNNPTKSSLVQIDVVIRDTTLHNGLETKKYVDKIVATWKMP